jgi:hypothetical protein
MKVPPAEAPMKPSKLAAAHYKATELVNLVGSKRKAIKIIMKV